jgi:hypothetical protein
MTDFDSVTDADLIAAYARGKLQLQQNKAADPEKYARS